MWAGWCLKVICDRSGFGVKSGMPYIWYEKASNWKNNFIKENKGILWQEEIVPFFQNIKFSSSANTVEKCYAELDDFVEKDRGHIDEYFLKLAKAMRTWSVIWTKFNK